MNTIPSEINRPEVYERIDIICYTPGTGRAKIAYTYGVSRESARTIEGWVSVQRAAHDVGLIIIGSLPKKMQALWK